jgi:hypothetical protein
MLKPALGHRNIHDRCNKAHQFFAYLCVPSIESLIVALAGPRSSLDFDVARR